MKKRINLFDQRIATTSPEDIYKKIRTGSLLFLLVLLVSGIGLFFYSQSLDNRMKNLKYSQTVATHKLQASAKNSQKIILLMKNKDLLEKYLKDDAQFLPYYTLLNNLLLATEGNPTLASIQLDKSRKTTFSLYFENYENLRLFLIASDTEQFTRHFESLTFSPISITPESTEYTLNVTGTFVPIL